MELHQAISIVLEAAEIRRQQWLVAGQDDHAMDGDLNDCIAELYEADHAECEFHADQLAVSIATVQDSQP